MSEKTYTAEQIASALEILRAVDARVGMSWHEAPLQSPRDDKRVSPAIAEMIEADQTGQLYDHWRAYVQYQNYGRLIYDLKQRLVKLEREMTTPLAELRIQYAGAVYLLSVDADAVTVTIGGGTVWIPLASHRIAAGIYDAETGAWSHSAIAGLLMQFGIDHPEALSLELLTRASRNQRGIER